MSGRVGWRGDHCPETKGVIPEVRVEEPPEDQSSCRSAGSPSLFRRYKVRLIAAIASTVVISVVIWAARLPGEALFTWFADEPEVNAGANADLMTPLSLPASSPGAPAAGPKRLHLIATIPGRNAHEGTAQLGTDLGSGQVYGAGAMLENSAVLREIHGDHVVLERDGKRTKLYIDGIAMAPTKRPEPDSALVMIDAKKPESPRLPSSPPDHSDTLRAAPRFENQVIVGFDVYAGTNRSQFARLGLQPGDLLLSVDGAPMVSTEALDEALRNLKEGRAVTAMVSRNGQQMSLSWQRIDNSDSEQTLAASGSN